MQANPEKFQALVLCGRNKSIDFQFKVNGGVIKPILEAKLLGITLDVRLNFAPHIATICKKAAKQINALSRLTKVLSPESKLNIFNAFIVSNFNYCSVIYHLCGKMNAKKMEKLQERGIRIMSNDFVSSYFDILSKYNKLMLYEQRELLLLESVYKAKNELLPPIDKDFFDTHETPYSLRDTHMINIPHYNTSTYGFNSLRIQGAMLWNHLPTYVKQAGDLCEFKNRLLETHMICSCGSCFRCTYAT